MATRRNPPKKGPVKSRRTTATLDLQATEVSEDKSSETETKKAGEAGKIEDSPAAKSSDPSAKSPTGQTDESSTASGHAKSAAGATTSRPGDAADPKDTKPATFGASSGESRQTTSSFWSSSTAPGSDKSTSGPAKAGASGSKFAGQSEPSKSSSGFSSTSSSEPKRATAPEAASSTKPGAKLAVTAAATDKPSSRSDAERKPTKSVMPPPPPSGGGSSFGGFVSHAVAGVVGALAVLLGAQFLPQLGVQLGAPKVERVGLDQVDGLADRLAGLEQSVNDTKAQASTAKSGEDQLKAVDERIQRLEAMSPTVARIAEDQKALSDQATSLESRIAELPSGAGQVSEELKSRLTKLEDTISTLAAAAQNGDGTIPELAALTGRINDFAVQLDTKIGALRSSLDQDLQGRVGALDERLGQLGATDTTMNEAVATLRAGGKRLSGDLENLRNDATRLRQQIVTVEGNAKQASEELTATQKAAEERLSQAQSEAADRLAAAQQKIASIETALSKFGEEMEAQLKTFAKPDDVTTALAPITERVSSLNDKVASVVDREQTRQQSTQRIVLALELANLKRAMDRGESIAKPLSEVKQLAPQGLDLSPLEAYSKDGAPTTASLQKGFRQMARAALDAENAPQSNSVLDQFLSGAQSIIRVRRTGNVSGDSTEAVVARVEGRLKDGDLVAALAEAQGLSGKAKDAAAPWLEKLQARVAVDQAMADVESVLKRSLSAPATN